ncbi:MAG: Nif3-like dinuclear metal center hexameric protein, partial [Victivallales bacterium]|nr:Nif3-like dinuclear metal center hexameric protein [Victivallales bacterium]
MVKLLEIKRFLDETFAGLAPQDFSNNGLQLDAGMTDVRKMAFAVDACQKTFDMAVANGAQLLFVHHGFSWGGGIKYLNGYTGRRVATMMAGGVSLYACHLPLDMHPVHGNNAVLCRMLDLQDVKPFFAYHGENIGFCGRLPKPMELSEIASILVVKLHTKS